MIHATIEKSKEIYSEFMKFKGIFPYMRKDYLERSIINNQCIFQDGVIILYKIYKRNVKIGNVLIPKGSIMITEILNSSQFNGRGSEIFLKFFKEIVDKSGNNLYLTVRKDNITACKFYEKNKMKQIGNVYWKNGTISGIIYSR